MHNAAVVHGCARVSTDAQDSAKACIHRRHESGWRSIDVIGEKQKLELASLGINTRLGALYAGIDLRQA